MKNFRKFKIFHPYFPTPPPLKKIHFFSWRINGFGRLPWYCLKWQTKIFVLFKWSPLYPPPFFVVGPLKRGNGRRTKQMPPNHYKKIFFIKTPHSWKFPFAHFKTLMELFIQDTLVIIYLHNVFSPFRGLGHKLGMKTFWWTKPSLRLNLLCLRTD